MAKRGGKRHLKAIAASGYTPIRSKKEKVFLAKPIPGPHTQDRSTTINNLLIEVINTANTRKEVRYILGKNIVKIDEKTIGEERYPVGLWDVVEIDGDKVYRVYINERGKLDVREETPERKNLKLLKIKNKVVVNGGVFQLTFHDGRTYLTKDNNYKVGDVVVFDLSKKEIVKHVKAEPGTVCLITDGKHVGKVAKLKAIEEKGEKEAILENKNGEEIRTRYAYIFPLAEGFY